jgi:hypothetical protein
VRPVPRSAEAACAGIESHASRCGCRQRVRPSAQPHAPAPPGNLSGKEAVDGSSPSEGFTKGLDDRYDSRGCVEERRCCTCGGVDVDPGVRR